MENHDDRLQEVYSAERSLLIEGALEAARNFDKYLLALSGGALALSITFIDQLSDGSAPKYEWILLVAWLSLLFTIVSVMWMIHLSCKANEKFCEILDREAAAGGDFLSRARDKQSRENVPSRIDWLRRTSLCLFALGIVLLGVFSACNLPHHTTIAIESEDVMPDKIPNKQQPRTSQPNYETADIPHGSVEGASAKPPLAPILITQGREAPNQSPQNVNEHPGPKESKQR